MRSVGIRELRQRASELLRRVQAGEVFEITDRGRPIAVLSPVGPLRPVERLKERGDLEPAKGDPAGLPEPIRAARGEPLPSKVLENLRRDER